jgi:hypothetical protein
MPMMPRRPVWLLCLLLTWWAACPMPGRCETSLPTEKPDSPTYLSDEEQDALDEAEAKQILRETVDKAVKVAVAPLLADVAGYRAERDGWRAMAEAGDAELKVERKKVQDRDAELVVTRLVAIMAAIGVAVGAGLLGHALP